MTDIFPTLLARDAGNLRIHWSDGMEQLISYKRLREACPCATCIAQILEKQTAPANPLRVLSPLEARPLEIARMQPVGNYAYSIQFSDGHDTGIYTIEYLRGLEQNPAGQNKSLD
ncbi:MAG TPA: DUF971 domain-containing protein [Pirellulaceae bacterium]|nr:DUF971 domain-containing protein [Pirellulaceae bacterium]HMO92540.1 DUF971 domain-containing protein [Pirellulaceae bacterium]HMP68978.1 DUF971 domain-containing protein [Pirellulaceae bacterium]